MPKSNQDDTKTGKGSGQQSGSPGSGTHSTGSGSHSSGAAAHQGGSKEDSKQQGSGDTSNRGFASMDPDEQREIAAEGGRAAHASGHAHEFTSEEARKAGSMSHKNDGNQQSDSSQGGSGSHSGSGAGSSRGGTPEQHAEAGRQSHKNDGRK